MSLELSQQDREYLWHVVDQAVKKAGSHANLFANRFEIFDESGRIRFDWPVWMIEVKGYLIAKYGESGANALLLSTLREVMAEPNYNAYLRNGQNSQYRFRQVSR